MRRFVQQCVRTAANRRPAANSGASRTFGNTPSAAQDLMQPAGNLRRVVARCVRFAKHPRPDDGNDCVRRTPTHGCSDYAGWIKNPKRQRGYFPLFQSRPSRQTTGSRSMIGERRVSALREIFCSIPNSCGLKYGHTETTTWPASRCDRRKRHFASGTGRCFHSGLPVGSGREGDWPRAKVAGV